MAVLYYRMIERRDTSANWNSENPILAAGEIGVELVAPTVVYFKIGDGVTAWSGLPYSNGGVPVGPTVLGTAGAPIEVSDPIDAPLTNDTLLFAEGDGGDVTVDNIGAPPAIGARLRIAVSSPDTVTLSNGGNIKVNGGSVILGMQTPATSVIDLFYDGTNWVETSRNGI